MRGSAIWQAFGIDRIAVLVGKAWGFYVSPHTVRTCRALFVDPLPVRGTGGSATIDVRVLRAWCDRQKEKRRELVEHAREVAKGRPPQSTKALADRLSASWVYFIQPEGGGLIKIGRALDPVARLAELQVGCPVRLLMLGKCAGGDALERDLHRRFSHHRERGEWFRPDAEVVEYIARLHAPRH